MNKKILIYSQDVGGANYIAPSINYIVNRYPSLVVVHPLSEQTFKKHKIAFYPLSNFFERIPPQEAEIESFLLQHKISHLYCTTSSPYRDLTNSYFINISRKLNIPTFGIMDHWKGYDRFINDRGEITYFPDYIGCIDRFCKDKLSAICKDPERVFVVGHPHLENVLGDKRRTKEISEVINILIISQPDSKDGSFKSIFAEKIGFESILENIIKQVNFLKKETKINIKLRIHPKEQTPWNLLEGVGIVKNEDWQDALCHNNIFLGLDSMLLVEASLAGRCCISLKTQEFSDFSDSSIPYKIWEEVKDLNNLENAIRKCIIMTRSASSHNTSNLQDIVRGSLKRLVHYINVFVKGSESVDLKGSFI